jgi:TonB family protein
MREAGVAGTVRVTFRVNPDGMVESGSVRVIGTAHPELASAVTQAVSGWEFTLLGSQRRASSVPVRLSVEFVAGQCAAGGSAASWSADNRKPHLTVTGCGA